MATSRTRKKPTTSRPAGGKSSPVPDVGLSSVPEIPAAPKSELESSPSVDVNIFNEVNPPVANELNTTQINQHKSLQLINYVDTLVGLNEQHEVANTALTRKLESKLDEVTATIELQLEQFLANLNQKFQTWLAQVQPVSLDQDVDFNSNSNFQSEAADDDDDSSDELLTDWERRKKQMLAEYASSGDETAGPTSANKSASHSKQAAKCRTGSAKKLASNPASPVVDHRQPPRLGDSEEGHALEALHDSIAQLDKIDSVEIETLKEQLTSKLRDAEVEISINRAKLSQQWAALEQKQNEMAQRESALKSKYGNLTEATKKAGLLDRLSRHLTRRSDDNVK